MTAAVCIILDVGVHMATDIEHAVNCLKLLVQRKFFQGKKEEVAVVLCGTVATSNELADDDGNFIHISLIRELAPLDWDILEFFNSESLLSPDDADVVDALIVGVNHLVHHCKKRKELSERRVLLVSNLLGPADTERLDEIIENLRVANVQLSLIGFKLPERESPENESASNQSSQPGPSVSRDNNDSKVLPAQIAVRELWSHLDGESYTFDEALPALAYYETRTVAQRGWKVEFQIGDSLALPVEGFTQVREAHGPPLTQLYAADPSIPIHTVTSYHAQDENATELNSKDVIRGHRYGSTMVPFTSQDKSAVQPPAEKCLSLIGFTQAANVPVSLHLGDSVLVFVANCPTEDHTAARGLAALAQALFELDGVALVRRVYNRVSAPRLGVLIPEVRGTQVALFYTDLAFADDVRTFRFPSLPLCTNSSSKQLKTDKHAPSEKQLSAMDQFVTSLILSKTDEDDESDAESDASDNKRAPANNGLNLDLKPEQLPNPWIQRLFSCFRQRGLNPSESLIPSTSQQPVDSRLVAQNLPGLEQLLAQIYSLPDQAADNSLVESARRHLVDCLPALSQIDKEETESGASAAKRRRLMAAELFGLQPTDEGDQNQNDGELKPPGSISSLSQDSQISDVGSVNPVADFDRLVAQGDLAYAAQRLEARIIQLVTDPYTGSLLRPRAISCLVAYRDRAKHAANVSTNSSRTLAEAYNRFIRTWREDLAMRGCFSNERSNTGPMDPRFSFWSETITQGFGLITEEDAPGIGVTQAEAAALLSSSEDTKPPVNEKGDLTPLSNLESAKVTEQLLDELE